MSHRGHATQHDLHPPWPVMDPSMAAVWMVARLIAAFQLPEEDES